MTYPAVKLAPSTDRIAFLDALRFMAAGAVLVQHAVEQEGEFGQFIVGLLSPGVFGVVLFFMVSGFVIPLSIGRRFDLSAFAIRRAFRIFPLTVATFLLLAVIGYGSELPEFAYVKAATTWDWIANLLLVQDYTGVTPLWGVTWTLSLEIAWYVIFAACVLCFGKKFDSGLFVVFSIALLAATCLSMLVGQRLPVGRVGMLYAAVLGCRVYHHQKGMVPGRRLIFEAGLFFLTTVLCNIVAFGYFRHPNITMNQALYPWIAAPIVFLFVSSVPGVRASRFINNPLVGTLGAISFSTYLLHPFAIAFAKMFAPEHGMLVASVALTLALSFVGYWVIELPGQKLGKRVIAARLKAAEIRRPSYSRAVSAR